MKLSFIAGSPSGRPVHTVEFATVDALHHWLMQDRSGAHWYLAVHGDDPGEPPECVRGAVESGLQFTWIRGGWNIPRQAAETVWFRALRDRDAARYARLALAKFLGEAEAFAREAVHPKPAVVR